MYLQITTRCNMLCAHCGYSCTAEGEDMSLDTVRAAIEWAEQHGHAIYIGGGEPTLHPQFLDILVLLLSSDATLHGITTNGSHAKYAKMLFRLRDVLGDVSLSWDQFHDESLVDAGIRELFDSEYGHIKTVLPMSVAPVGRGADLAGFTEESAIEERITSLGIGCLCPDMHVKPSGDLYFCACPGAPCVGNINRQGELHSVWTHPYEACWYNPTEFEIWKLNAADDAEDLEYLDEVREDYYTCRSIQLLSE